MSAGDFDLRFPSSQNTDRELWRERMVDLIPDSIHVTEDGGIGMKVNGHVIVLSIRKWHELAVKDGQK